ncbi:hypothetical protein DAEQUDRAFT_763324 [Daedalea quercina L-15889]|uniref:DUF1793-domain-containing protein n=1 Tax=Daedalea quercina L-15889 TaxID=1314783 RepID=A0A165SMG4_9APHY|nr:hypothetical protein DAEQUDRAFT_763324 [Daedalea quercina L-15889]
MAGACQGAILVSSPSPVPGPGPTNVFLLLPIVCAMRGLQPFYGLCWFFLAWSQLVLAQSLTPAAIPLAVRSPYLSTWLGSTNGTDITNAWPVFWSESNGHVNGWAGLIRVDGSTYKWLGTPAEPSGLNNTNLTTSQITPTRTIWTILAGPMKLTVTFLTPIEASSTLLSAPPPLGTEVLPAVIGLVYSDVSAEWLSGNASSSVQWNTTTTNQLIYHQVELQEPTQFTEVDDQAVDGTLYYAIAQGTSATYQTGADATVRGQFTTKGTLANTQDTNFRAISDDYPVFGLAVDLGTIQSTSSPVVWTIGFVRDPSVQYTTGAGTVQNRSPYYVTQYSSAVDAMEAFVTDSSDAMTRSTQLDNEITQNATSISSEYSDLVSLAARQTFGAIDITVSQGTDSQWNTSDVMIFMKNMGNNRRVNPVEIMYAAFPMFLCVNASYGRPLLTPLLEYQSSSMYTLPYAASDIGSGYPIASGDSSTNQLGVEQSANMIIMALAHARASGDGTLLVQYYDLLKSWADYLVQNSETPSNQATADGQSSSNMTNLAIKGIIAIEAMSQIASVVGNGSAASTYADIASTDASAWESLALSQNSAQGLLFTYGSTDTWALTYNLYADLLLGTNVVSQSIYDRQGDYYNSLISDGTSRTYGLPLDSAAAVQGNSAWLSFTGATTNSSVRDQFISMIWKRATYNGTAGVFPATYDVDSGAVTGGAASPAQGAMYALLALDVKNQSISTSGATSGAVSGSTSKTNVGAIVGGVVGGVGGAALIILAFFFFWWRRRKARVAGVPYEKTGVDESRIVSPDPFPYNNAPSTQPTTTDRSQSMDTAVETATQAPPVPLMSTKLREHLRYMQPDTPAGVGSSSSGSRTQTSGSSTRYSEDPPTTLGLSTSPRSEIHGLRAEVENLRRYMEELHAHQLEAPPSYVEE